MQIKDQYNLPFQSSANPQRVASRNLGFPYILMGGFAMLIVIGTVMLLLPQSNQQGTITPFIDALFTATSAVTVTGLIVVDTSNYWTTFGHVVIMFLIFLGGIGIMTSATFLMIIIGGRITLANRLLLRENLGVNQLGGLVGLTVRIVMAIVIIQFIGFLILLVSLRHEFSFPMAIWQALFHSISGFNNAGFVISPNSNNLSVFGSNISLMLTMTVLIMFGSLSYSVWMDLFKYRKFSRFTLDSKLVIIFTLSLIFIGTIVLFISEYSNPLTFGDMTLSDKLINSFFHSISGRTAGFTTVDFGDMEQHSKFFLTGLMFIGGASASTAGGIKVNTLAVLLVATLASIKGNTHVNAFGREIPQTQIFRALTVLVLAVLMIFFVAFLLTISEGFPFIDILFETVSAFGTVGLSTGITKDLSDIGKYIIIATMFIGRVGPITLALVLARKEETPPYRYAEERVKIG